MQFRQKALSKLQSPEELDLPVRLARPQGLLVLAVTVLVMAAAGVWACTGSVSAKLSAPGILIHSEGSYLLQSPFAGQVTAVLAKEGQPVSSGTPLIEVGTEHGTRAVRAVAAGRVTTLAARTGTVLATGADVAVVERLTGPDDPLVAMVYVPGDSGGTVSPGAQVDLTVDSVSRARFGVLRGSVQAVGRAPQTPAQLTGFLGDSRLADRFSRQGNPIAVLVRLQPAATRSGYRWSSAGGPPYPLDTPAPVTAAVHLAAQRPVDWLLP
ncbi:HlyD family efflux transporter periplasmic adaptor subunit [Streptomyces orinoci]|uniref:HlyD family efflux transporter periplasmic adaptor subunit n=1 Tax=Streptomyces orinoci TaxID=67339 RepID=A0ABV3K3I8_STRON|nr:HlyD family efflux transporter periplasmic adaptor subunit [Streptomyces orinoci]